MVKWIPMGGDGDNRIGEWAWEATTFSRWRRSARSPQRSGCYRHHPLRAISEMVKAALNEVRQGVSVDTASGGAARDAGSSPFLLQVLYAIRSERMLMEQLEHKLLFSWFADLSMDEAVLKEARQRGLPSNENISADGALIEAWASQKIFRPKDEDPDNGGRGGRSLDVDFRGEKRSNAPHRSTTDTDALHDTQRSKTRAKL